MAISTTELMKRSKKPFFTPEQLIQIYEASGMSNDAAALKKAAQELYPGVLDDGEPPVRVAGPFGRWFDRADGSCGPAKFTIVSNGGSGVGVLHDGTAKPF